MLDIDLLGNPNIICESESRRFKDVELVDEAYKEEDQDQALRKVGEALALVESKLQKFGNIVHDSVPISKDEADNAVIRTWGEKRLLKVMLIELVNLLGIVESREESSDGVLLNQALINFGLDFLEKRGYMEVQTPFVMRKDIMAQCAQLQEFDEVLYKLGEGDSIYLIATSEQPLCAYHINESIDPSRLPMP
ncbi:hypothetical protein M0R45_032040 [Rubus argutus]|uniref:Uncharacterized protein n=1 Tax=Rubus argutus TaxID=59490 RepID=A0AAW1WGH5_RUBAR